MSHSSSSDTQEMLCANVHTYACNHPKKTSGFSLKSTGGDYNSEIFSDIPPKLEFELVFLEFPRVQTQAQ